MKEVARDWAAQGLEPVRVWNGLMRRFNLSEADMPPMATVQRFVHNCVAGHLGGSDLISVVRQKVSAAAFTGEEEETRPFTLTLRVDGNGKPVIGKGSDEDPFVLGISTKSLLRNADRDASTFILHLDATYKLAQNGYPVVVVGVSDRARQFHLVAIFIVSQQQQPQYAEVLRILRCAFEKVVGRPMQIRWAMGDADSAQWNAVNDAFGGDGAFRFLMCYFHVVKKVYEKTRSLESALAELVLRDIHDLHFARDEEAYRQRLAEVEAEWANFTPLNSFSAYFKRVWMNTRVWRWQAFHTPSGYAATNNPCETFNAAIKRDVTLRRKLKMSVLIEQLMTLCQSESVRPRAFATAPAIDDRLLRRTKALARDGLLREYLPPRNTIAFLLNNAEKSKSYETVTVIARAALRKFDVFTRRSREDLPTTAQLNVGTARMETLDMPQTGWEVDVTAKVCPCRFFGKYCACVHLLYALDTIGTIDYSGREKLYYRGNNKRKRASSSRPAGRPRNSGSALQFN